jgi:Na+/proline symporter
MRGEENMKCFIVWSFLFLVLLFYVIAQKFCNHSVIVRCWSLHKSRAKHVDDSRTSLIHLIFLFSLYRALVCEANCCFAWARFRFFSLSLSLTHKNSLMLSLTRHEVESWIKSITCSLLDVCMIFLPFASLFLSRL